MILSHARLPIPPQAHLSNSITSLPHRNSRGALALANMSAPMIVSRAENTDENGQRDSARSCTYENGRYFDADQLAQRPQVKRSWVYEKCRSRGKYSEPQMPRLRISGTNVQITLHAGRPNGEVLTARSATAGQHESCVAGAFRIQLRICLEKGVGSKLSKIRECA